METLQRNVASGLRSVLAEKCPFATFCTHATERASLLANEGLGDEGIMPSFTFLSTIDALVLRGDTPVFVDIRPDTMNIDEKLIEDAVAEKNSGIVPVRHVAVGCEMDEIMYIAKRPHLFVVKDAVHGTLAEYKGKA